MAHYSGMDLEDFKKKMEDMKTPKVAGVKEPVEMKLAILNAQRSATIGVWFVVVPCFFIACVFMKYIFHIHLGLLDTFEEMITVLDTNPRTWWIQPVVLVGLPIISIIINTLSITHFKLDAQTQSIFITLKLRWVNIIILLISITIVSIFLLYLVTENFQPRPGH